MNIANFIKKYKFKVKFRDWQMMNDAKLVGRSYDYAFELFMYDAIEPAVKEIISDHLDENEKYLKLKRENKSLFESISKRHKELDIEEKENKKLRLKIESLKLACKAILDD